MTAAIVKQIDLTTLKSMFQDAKFSLDAEADTITDRVTRARAEELLKEWKQILFDYDVQEGKDAEALFQGGDQMVSSLLGTDASNTELQVLKDKLFVQTGEDQYDTFTAFDHYQLDWTFTQRDRQRGRASGRISGMV